MTIESDLDRKDRPIPPIPLSSSVSRTLIISDVHANATALDAVLTAERDADSVVFLGDAVDNGPRPESVCEHLRELDLLASVRGNHDRTVLDASEASEAGDRTDESDASSPSVASDGGEETDAITPGDNPFAEWQAWTHRQLSGESRAFLQSLDTTTTLSLGDTSLHLRLHHGDFSPPEDYDANWQTRATPEDDPSLFEAVADRYDEEVILHGHSHYPFEETVAGTTFVNPGSVGLQRAGWPADEARYAVFEDGAFDLRSVSYDTGPVAAESRELNSPFLEIWGQPGASASDD